MEGFRLVKKDIPPQLRGEVEENTTFYYSNFKLFNEYSELIFSKYITFKKDLQVFLGEEWYNYAQKSIFRSQEGVINFLTSQEVFNVALEVWLELPKDAKMDPDPQSHLHFPQKNVIISSNPSGLEMENPEEEKKSDTPGFKSFTRHRSEDNQMLENFMVQVREKFSTYEINETIFKGIIQAFNVSATKVWKEMASGYFGESTTKNGGFINESKKFLLSKLQTFYNSKSKVLKPILVATEKIKDYVIDTSKLRQPVQIQMPDDKDLRNLSTFSSNLQSDAPSTPSNDSSVPDDEQEMKRNFKQLKISTNNNNGDLLGKRTSYQANTVVEIKKINKKLERMLNQHTIEFAAYYVNNMVKTSNRDWQVSRNFVTNMVEVNYNKLLQLENQISNKNQEIGNDVKIRFIQPAQDFYGRLMEIWIIFKTQALDRDILFPEYLDKSKKNLGDLWNDKFMAAVQNFFMTLYYEWSHLKHVEVDTEQKILLFTKKVKESMLKIWEESVVKKAEELSNKTLNNQQQQ